MSESTSLAGVDPLSARLRELSGYFAAPTADRLTEEQRALALGIARRLVDDVAACLDPAMATGDLWRSWLHGGIPGAAALAAACFARAEEHRWREQSAQRTPPPPMLADGENASGDAPADTPLSDIDRARLALRIADRRRFDALGNPSLAIADVDGDLFRALLRDIAAWRLGELGGDRTRAIALGERARTAADAQAAGRSISDAGESYYRILGDQVPRVAAAAVARHDWPTLVALAAAAARRGYADMALALLTAETAALPSLLAPLKIDRAALAPLEASLAMLPARAVAAGPSEAVDAFAARDGGP